MTTIEQAVEVELVAKLGRLYGQAATSTVEGLPGLEAQMRPLETKLADIRLKRFETSFSAVQAEAAAIRAELNWFLSTFSQVGQDTDA